MIEGAIPWPQQFADRYRKAGYWSGVTFGDLLTQLAQKHGPRTAVVGSSIRWSYRELDSRATRLAAGFYDQGFRRGDRVIVQLPNVPELVPVLFALFRLGVLPILALPAHRKHEIERLCDIAEASAIVIPDRWAGFDYRGLARDIQQVRPRGFRTLVVGDPQEFTALDTLLEPEPATITALPTIAAVVKASEIALFQLSGGTTGTPKLIPRTHDDYLYSVRASADLCRLTPESTYLAVLPAVHNFPLSSPGILGTLAAGGRVVMADNGSPDIVFPIIEREQVTITALVPPLAVLWLDAEPRLPRGILKVLQVGGAKLLPQHARRISSTFGCQLQQVFGMAEGLVNYTRLDDPPALVEGTQGRPLCPADEIRVVDERNNEVREGKIGQLLTRGAYTIRGYYRAPEHNARAFTADGFYRTGDLVRRLPSGHLTVVGRIKDMINRGGDKVSAEELESCLADHVHIRDVAVVAMSDSILGERTCAFVIPRGDAPKLHHLRTFLRDVGIAEYKLPDRLEIVESFPLTRVGKVDRKQLRTMISSSASTI